MKPIQVTAIVTIDVDLLKSLPMDQVERIYMECGKILTGEYPTIDLEKGVIKVKDLGLRTQALNVLTFQEIGTVAQLVTKTPKELLRYRNFGLMCLKDVELSLKELGLSLRESGVPAK